MKTLPAILIIFIILFSEASPQMKKIEIKSGSIFDIPEVGAIIIKKNNQNVVEYIIPVENRPKEFKNIDLQTNDIILMINGKKADNLEECSEIYNNLKTGEDLRLGVKRGEQMFIVTIVKADPKDLPKLKRVIIKDGKDDTKGKDKTLKIQKPEPDGDIIIKSEKK